MAVNLKSVCLITARSRTLLRSLPVHFVSFATSWWGSALIPSIRQQSKRLLYILLIAVDLTLFTPKTLTQYCWSHLSLSLASGCSESVCKPKSQSRFWQWKQPLFPSVSSTTCVVVQACGLCLLMFTGGHSKHRILEWSYLVFSISLIAFGLSTITAFKKGGGVLPSLRPHCSWEWQLGRGVNVIHVAR